MKKGLVLLVVLVMCSGVSARAADDESEKTTTRKEILAVELFSPGITLNSPLFVGFGGFLRIFTLVGAGWFWTPLELGGGVSLLSENSSALGYGGTQAGFSFSLGDTDRLRFSIGLGVGGGVVALKLNSPWEHGTQGGGGPMLTQTLRIDYLTQGGILLGGGVRTLAPLMPLSFNRYSTISLVFFEIGFTGTP